jgi:hypothetical protein
LCLEIFTPITENLPLSHKFFSGHRVYYCYTFCFSKICSSDVWSVWGRICWWILEMKELVTGSIRNSCDPRHTWITFKLCISTTANSGQWTRSMHGSYFHSVFSLFLSVAPTIASPHGLTIELPKPSPGFITRHAVSPCVEAAEVLLRYWMPQREFDAHPQIILVLGRRLILESAPSPFKYWATEHACLRLCFYQTSNQALQSPSPNTMASTVSFFPVTLWHSQNGDDP